MMSPDDFLDWLESKREDACGEDEAGFLEAMIIDFNREFDTRDSPLEPPPTDRKKKEKRT